MKFSLIGKSLLAVAFGGAGASICSAQNYATAYDNHPVMTVTAGQGGFVRLPDLSPRPATYSLTGEPSAYAQSARVWQGQLGPVYQFGNGMIVIPPTR